MVKELIISICTVYLPLITLSQPKIFKTKGEMAEICEYVNEERKCTLAGVLHDKKSTFIIYQSKVEWYSSSETPMVFKVLKIDNTVENITTYVLEDVEHTRYILNIPTNDRKLLVLATNEANLTFFIRE